MRYIFPRFSLFLFTLQVIAFHSHFVFYCLEFHLMWSHLSHKTHEKNSHSIFRVLFNLFGRARTLSTSTAISFANGAVTVVVTITVVFERHCGKAVVLSFSSPFPWNLWFAHTLNEVLWRKMSEEKKMNKWRKKERVNNI